MYMSLDRTFIERNRASTERIRALAARLTDEQLQHPVGEHWTVAIVFAHLAFWDRRAMYALDMTERNGKLFAPEIDIFVNDLSLPLWAAIPPRQAADRHRTAERWSSGWKAFRLPWEIYITSAGSSGPHRDDLDKTDAALNH
jgi:hypothetical protein